MIAHGSKIILTIKFTNDTKASDEQSSEFRARRVLLRKYTCSDALRIDNDSLFRHTGVGRYPSPSRPWMPACAGMTSLRNGFRYFHYLCVRKIMIHFVVNYHAKNP